MLIYTLLNVVCEQTQFYTRQNTDSRSVHMLDIYLSCRITTFVYCTVHMLDINLSCRITSFVYCSVHMLDIYLSCRITSFVYCTVHMLDIYLSCRITTFVYCTAASRDSVNLKKNQNIFLFIFFSCIFTLQKNNIKLRDVEKINVADNADRVLFKGPITKWPVRIVFI